MAIPPSSGGKVAPKSTHVVDPSLQPFLQPTFDPADYLNAALPSLSLSSVSSRPLKQGHAVPLADLSSQTQDLISQLNAHTTRLSTILTQLTDDILRSGGRLAYEVEVLRGETIGLTETLTDGLKDDIPKFVAGGLAVDGPRPNSSNPLSSTDNTSNPTDPSKDDLERPQDTTTPAPPTTAPIDPQTPEYITQLRSLTLIRARLESVIKIFGEAMHWTLPPSEISLTSSLISVSAPDPSSTSPSNPADLEARGKEFSTSLRAEISDLITGADDAAAGFDAASVRIQALRDLATVWKGTAEEKARARFVEGLVRLAEEKQRERENASGLAQRAKSGRRESVDPVLQAEKAQALPQRSGGGFLDNLQRIRKDIGFD